MFESKPHHHRLRDFESFDRLTFEVVPRYKTSGLSGDEWRQHVAVKFWFKGEVVHEEGYRDMRTALMCAPRAWLDAQCPIPERVIALEREGRCDQPSCAEKAVGRFLLKRLTSAQGEFLDMAQQYGKAYRQFCAKHLRRGDCSREDSDDNYEPMDGVTAAASTNTEESPASVMAIEIGSVEEVVDAVAALGKAGGKA